MILKDFFNYEKSFSTDIISIDHFEIKPKEKKEIDNKKFERFYIFYNIGQLLQLELDNIIVFCPPKHGFIGINKKPAFFLKESSYYKFSIISLSNNFSNEIIEKIYNVIDEQYQFLIQKKSFVFSFSLNVEIIELIEHIYKSLNNFNTKLFNLEIEAKFLHLLTRILKEIFYDNIRYNNIISTMDTKIFLILKSLFEEHIPLENSFNKYQVKEQDFIKYYSSFNPKYTYEELKNFGKKI